MEPRSRKYSIRVCHKRGGGSGGGGGGGGNASQAVQTPSPPPQNANALFTSARTAIENKQPLVVDWKESSSKNSGTSRITRWETTIDGVRHELSYSRGTEAQKEGKMKKTGSEKFVAELNVTAYKPEGSTYGASYTSKTYTFKSVKGDYSSENAKKAISQMSKFAKANFGVDIPKY